ASRLHRGDSRGTSRVRSIVTPQATINTPPARRIARSELGIAVGLFCLSLALGLAAIVLGRFDGLYGQDSFAYFNYALGPLRESLLRGEPPPSFFWPLGYPLVALLASF